MWYVAAIRWRWLVFVRVCMSDGLCVQPQAPLQEKAVTEIHKLFTWAKSSSKGLLLFIDEAEAFLGSRDRGDISEHMRNVLSALLYQTGTQVRGFVRPPSS